MTLNITLHKKQVDKHHKVCQVEMQTRCPLKTVRPKKLSGSRLGNVQGPWDQPVGKLSGLPVLAVGQPRWQFPGRGGGIVVIK